MFPLFKACTRPAMIPWVNVPINAGVGAFMFIAVIAQIFSYWFWLMLVPAFGIMNVIAKHDDRAFTVLGFYVMTKFRYVLKRGLYALWGACSYAPFTKRKLRRVNPKL